MVVSPPKNQPILQSHRIHVWYIYTYIWLIFMVNVGEYTIHGSYGNDPCSQKPIKTVRLTETGEVKWSELQEFLGTSGEFWPGGSRWLIFQFKQVNYCWWKKSCTTWDVWNPIDDGINYLSAGAGFLPSTVVHKPRNSGNCLTMKDKGCLFSFNWSSCGLVLLEPSSEPPDLFGSIASGKSVLSPSNMLVQCLENHQALIKQSYKESHIFQVVEVVYTTLGMNQSSYSQMMSGLGCPITETKSIGPLGSITTVRRWLDP